MVSDCMLSSLLLLISHMKRKLYHATSVLPKLHQCGLVLFLFCFKRRVCILQDCDVTSVFLSLGGRKHVQLRGFQKSFSDLKLKKLDRLSWDM